MFLLFRCVLYKVADVNFYANKGLLLLLLRSDLSFQNTVLTFLFFWGLLRLGLHGRVRQAAPLDFKAVADSARGHPHRREALPRRTNLQRVLRSSPRQTLCTSPPIPGLVVSSSLCLFLRFRSGVTVWLARLVFGRWTL